MFNNYALFNARKELIKYGKKKFSRGKKLETSELKPDKSAKMEK